MQPMWHYAATEMKLERVVTIIEDFVYHHLPGREWRLLYRLRLAFVCARIADYRAICAPDDRPGGGGPHFSAYNCNDRARRCSSVREKSREIEKLLSGI